MSETGFHILTVCEGNLCRSPLAERLLAQRLPAFAIESAGVRAVVGAAMEPLAAAELERRGGSAVGFSARQLHPSMVDDADLVLAATRAIRTRLLEDAPRGLRRTFTLLEFAALAAEAEDGSPHEIVAWAAAHRSSVAGLPQDVRDPFRRGVEAHRDVAELVDQATAAIAGVFTR